ncbi:MAG: hypothetical protein DIU56_008270 [Pseudomonadota bacterium]
MQRTWRMIWAMTLLSLLAIGTTLVTLRAVAQTDEQITDDPTVAPDPQESADNNVSFPIDI